MALDFDHSFRQHATFTKKNKLSLEIVIKFRRLIRDGILQATQDQDLEMNGNKILKDLDISTEKRILFLTNNSQRTRFNINVFFPSEGLNFQWEGEPLRLNSIFKAKTFGNQNAQKLGYQTSSEESQSESETQVDDTQPHTSQKGAVGGSSKPLRLLE